MKGVRDYRMNLLAGLPVTKIQPMELKKKKHKEIAANILKKTLQLLNRTLLAKMVGLIWTSWRLIMRRWMLAIPITKLRRLDLKVNPMKTL